MFNTSKVSSHLPTLVDFSQLAVNKLIELFVLFSLLICSSMTMKEDSFLTPLCLNANDNIMLFKNISAFQTVF